MDKITTPIAVLLSGILIFIGLLILSNSLNDDYFYHVDSNLNEKWLIRTDKVTGLQCYTYAQAIDILQNKPPKKRDIHWMCSEDIHSGIDLAIPKEYQEQTLRNLLQKK